MKLKFLNYLLEYAIFSACILLAFLVFFEKYLEVPMLFRWLGHWHPLILHFPIVLIFVTIIQYWRKDTNLKWYLGVTTLLALISSLSGFLLSTENAIKGNQILIHQWSGIGVSLLLVIWWYFSNSFENKVNFMKGMQVLLAVLIIFTGHVGGSITHGENFLSFQPANSVNQVVADNPNIYLSFVQPILNEKCTKCHNADKSKGKLILTDYSSLAVGGEFGPGLDFSDLGKSSLKYHIELPLEDEFHMPPPDEEQLTEVELMILNSWIAAGATDTLTLSGLMEETSLYSYIQNKLNTNEEERYDRLPVISNERLKKLSSNYISVSRLYHGSDAVAVTVFANAAYRPEQLKPLTSISENIVALDLNSIAIGKQEIEFVKSCGNLEKLNLCNSPLTDQVLISMDKMQNLKTLNLFNTAITDAAVSGIADLPNLEEVFIYGTRITSSGIEKLTKSRSQFKVYSESDQAKEFFSVLPPATVTPLKHFFSEPFEINISHPLAGIDVFYTLDGTSPTMQSSRFAQPLFIDESTLIKFQAVKDGWESSRIDSVNMVRVGIKPDSMALVYPPDVKYPGRDLQQLTDMQKGPDNFSDSAWMAFREKDFVLKASWTKDMFIDKIILSSLVNTDSYLFPPESITIKAGIEKNRLNTIYYKKLDGLRDRKYSAVEYYACSFETRGVRYVEIIVSPLPKIPLWHQGVGQKGWFFIDEVVFHQSSGDDLNQ